MLIDGKMDEVSAMYESPITIWHKQVVQSVNETLEEAVMNAVTELHVSVDKAELIKALTYDRYQYERGYADGKADTQPKWISVKDRLPEDDGNLVLVSANGTFRKTTFQQAVCLAVYTKEDGWILEQWPEWENPNITHWMPILEPPEEDDENENA